nr:hypothetical protein [uncultured Rhodoblastus sp.]
MADIGPKRVGVALATFQHVLEGLFGQEADVLGEHGEKAAHKEHRDLFGRKSLRLQRLGNSRQTSGNVARDARRFLRRIEREGIGPDRRETFPHLRSAQVLKKNAKRLAVGELVEGFAVAPEVGIDLEAMADIADDDEGRRLMAGGQQADVIFGLAASIDHQHVPRETRPAPPARWRFGDEQIGLAVDLLVAALLLTGLLGLQDETVALIKIDPARRDSAVAAGLLYDALENIIVGFGIAGRVRRRQSEHVAQLAQEHRVIGAFLTAIAPLPAGDERIDFVQE